MKNMPFLFNLISIFFISLALLSCKGKITADLVLKNFSNKNSGLLTLTASANFNTTTPLATNDERTFTIKLENKSQNNIHYTITKTDINLTTINDCGLLIGAKQTCELIFTYKSPGGNQTLNSSIEIEYESLDKTYQKTFNLSLTTEPKNALIESLYTNVSSNWFHYVKQDSNDEFNSSGSLACDGTESSALNCLHSGEMKKISLAGMSSCQNLSASDALGVFQWTCVKVGSDVFFYSKLKDEKGLKDLLNANSWKSNHVNVYKQSNLIFQTAATTWWSNAIAPLSIIDSVLNISGENNIYTISADNLFKGFRIKSNNVALVGLGNPKPILTYQQAGACDTNGNDGTQNCLLAISQTGYKFGWIENLKFDATNSLNNAFVLSGAQNFAFRHLEITGFNRNAYVINLNGAAPTSRFNIFNSIKIYNNTSNGIALLNAQSYRNYFKNIEITGLNQGSGFVLQNSQYNIIDSTIIKNNSASGISVSSSAHFNYFKNLQIANNSGTGISISNSDDNKINNAKIFNNGGTGLSVAGTSRRFIGVNFKITNCAPAINVNLSSTDSDIILSNFIATNSTAAAGAIMSLGYKQIFTHFLVANNSDDGIYTVSGRQPQFFMSQGIFSNNGGQGYEGDSAVLFGIFDNMAFSNSSGGGFWNNYSPSSTFKGQMIFGNNSSNCSGGQTHNNKCTNAGTDGSNDWTNSQAGSNARLRLNHNLYNSFVGEVTSDSKNTSSLLSLDQNSISDWLNFDNDFRLWGKDDGQNLPLQNAQRGRCLTSAGDTCKPWDWRLKDNSSDPILFNRSGNSAASDVENEVFVGDETTLCPTAVHGNRVMTNNFSSPFSYLVNATEIMEDNIGNDNGLCESNESCLYSPNIGPYQGEGDYLSNGTCAFENGTVANVKMYAYPTNGIN